MIKLFTDSSSYIPLDLLVEHEITVLPLTVYVEGKAIYETEITNESFYEAIKTLKEMPKTAPVSVETAEAAFEAEVSRGNAVLAIFISSKVSETYDNAVKARRKVLGKYPKASITIIDSESSCMEEGMCVLAAAEAIKNGAWQEAVVEAVNSTIKRTRFLFVPPTLKYLKISKKIGAMQAAIGGLMQVTPILLPKEGVITLFDKATGKNRAINRILEVFKNDADKHGLEEVYVSHIDVFDEAMELADKIKKMYDVEVSISDIGPAIGSVVGPGSIGITYRTMEPIAE